MNQSEYVITITEAYDANPEAEIKLQTAANKNIQLLVDIDKNNKLDIEECVRIFKMFGHNSDSSDVAAFRIAFNSTESVPLDVAMEIFIQFMTDKWTSSTNDTMDEAIKTALHEEL